MKEKQTKKAPQRPNRHKALRRGLKIGVRLLVYPLAAVVMVVLAASILLQTEAARHKIKNLVEMAVERQFHGQLQVGKISGSLLFDISLEDIRLFHSEGPLLTASRVSANYFLPLLLTKVLYIHEVQMEGLSLNLVKTANGRWNVQSLLRPAKEKDPEDLSEKILNLYQNNKLEEIGSFLRKQVVGHHNLDNLLKGIIECF